MSNHYDDYYPSSTDMQNHWEREKAKKVKQVMDHFKVSEKQAKKMIEDFRVIAYACS